jgi:hypothetical protein
VVPPPTMETHQCVKPDLPSSQSALWWILSKRRPSAPTCRNRATDPGMPGLFIVRDGC